MLRALVRRDFLVTRSYRLAFVLDLVFGVLNLFVFFFISRIVGEEALADLKGAPSYFAFAAVGIAITVVIDAASVALANRIREEQLTGTLEALLVQPVGLVELALGLVSFPFVFAIGRSVLYLLISALFLGVDFGEMSWLGFTLTLLATSAAFSALGVVAAAAVLVIKRGDIVIGVMSFALGMLGGAFFPVSVFPSWVEPLGKIVPTRFAFDGLRSAIFQGAHWSDDALTLVLFSVFTLPLGVWLLRAALRWAIRSGSISQY